MQLGTGGRLPGSCEITAYYVAAEAFTNAAKHAGASAVDIVIEEAAGTLRVQVRDVGAGGADATRGSDPSPCTDAAKTAVKTKPACAIEE